jgi:hypothetical protein
MAESVLDVLMYLFETAGEEGVPREPDRDGLREELERAGFHDGEIDRALDWLDGLAVRRAEERGEPPTERAIRVFGRDECVRIDQEPAHRRVARQGQDDQQVPRQGLPGPGLLRPRPRPGAQGGRGRPRARLRHALRADREEREARRGDRQGRQGRRRLYLATDPDREGEAISWHIAEILRERGLLKDKPCTAWCSPRSPRARSRRRWRSRARSPADLVDAQQARRALDYLVGFNLSPVLWRKVQRGLSAGRVQSPALRMIVEREEEIEAFIAREYWTIEAELAHPSSPSPPS